MLARYKVDSNLPKISIEQIEHLENQLEKKLPADYKEFLLENNGGVPFTDTYDVIHENGILLYSFVIKHFLGINPKGFDDLLVTRNKYKSILPENMLPIAYDRFYNLTCLDLVSESIYFNNQQTSASPFKDQNTPISLRIGNLHFVSIDFDTFFDKLYHKRFN